MRQHKSMANSKTESSNSAVGLRGSCKAEQMRNTVLGKCFLSRRGIDSFTPGSLGEVVLNKGVFYLWLF